MNVFEEVYKIVEQIPKGKVTTYGQIAMRLGDPHMARTVGYAMRACPEGLPWHRVVNSQGRISISGEGAELQMAMLEAEGVIFSRDGKINLKKFLW
jgi:methylated-DNA-protein-cysteine methyltransferase-like protein